jgi:hypothetical protein
MADNLGDQLFELNPAVQYLERAEVNLSIFRSGRSLFHGVGGSSHIRAVAEELAEKGDNTLLEKVNQAEEFIEAAAEEYGAGAQFDGDFEGDDSIFGVRGKSGKGKGRGKMWKKNHPKAAKTTTTTAARTSTASNYLPGRLGKKNATTRTTTTQPKYKFKKHPNTEKVNEAKSKLKCFACGGPHMVRGCTGKVKKDAWLETRRERVNEVWLDSCDPSDLNEEDIAAAAELGILEEEEEGEEIVDALDELSEGLETSESDEDDEIDAIEDVEKVSVTSVSLLALVLCKILTISITPITTTIIQIDITSWYWVFVATISLVFVMVYKAW